MMSTIRILLLTLATSIALWGTPGFSNTEIANDISDLNLGEGVSDAYTYWNTFFCQVYPGDPACAASAPNPYYGPAWYNFNYGGWGFDEGRDHEHRGHHKKRHHRGCGDGCGRGRH